MEYIDVAKGIGIISVLVGHHLQGMDMVVKWIYSFHMPLFFFITGYLYELRDTKPESPLYLIKNQARRLLYPYVTFSVLMLLWKYFYHIVCGVPYTDGEDQIDIMLRNALTTNGIHALWFLPAMFWASTVYLILRRRNCVNWGALTFFVMIASGLSMFIHMPAIHASAYFPVMNYAVRVVLGISFICFGTLYARMGKMGNGVLISAAFISVSFGLMNEDVSMFGSYVGNPVLYYLAAVGGSVFILCLSKRISGFSGILKVLGKHSLIVMATDLSFPDEIAWMIVGIARINRLLPPTAVSCMMIIIQIGLVLLLIWFIQKYTRWMVKMPDWSKNRIGRRSKIC